MNPLLLPLGLATVSWVLYEMLASTLFEGSGPLSRLPMRALAALVQDRDGRVRRRPPPGAGVLALLLAITGWIVGLWLGWTLVFCAAPESVLGEGGAPASWWGRVYYAGFAVTTLGLGDLRAGGDLWRVLTSVAALTGLVLITLAITFLVPVVQGDQARRTAALHLALLGRESAALERALGRPGTLDTLLPLLAGLAQTHRQMPVLHWFGTRRRDEALDLALARLDHALGGADGADGRGAARRAIGTFLTTLEAAGIRPAPPQPGATTPRERLLVALVTCGGWTWADVTDGGAEDAGGRLAAVGELEGGPDGPGRNA